MSARRGEASFTTSDHRTYHLVLDLYAISEAEDVTGLSPNQLMQAISPVVDGAGNVVKTPPLKVLGALLYGGLKTAHPAITHADAIRLLDEGESVGVALAKALQGMMPKADPSAEGKGRAGKSGTGTRRRKTGPRKA